VADNTLVFERTLLKMKKLDNELQAENVRARLNPGGYIENLQSLIDESKKCEIEELPRLKFQADIYLAMLRKCLPDLKAVELSTRGALSIRIAKDEENL